MKNSQDKILTEEIESHIRSQIPFISKNIQEAIGKGFGTRAKLFAKEVGLRTLAGLRNASAPGRMEAERILQSNLYGELEPHLKSVGINPNHFKMVMTQYPKTRPTPPPSTAPKDVHYAHAAAMEAYNERQKLESQIEFHSRFNPNLRSALRSLRRSDVLGRRSLQRTLTDSDVTNPSGLMGRAEAIRQQRKQLQAQRRSEIPLEYSQYKNAIMSTPLFKKQSGTSVPVPTGSRQNLLVKSQGPARYTFTVGGPSPGPKLLDPNLKLRLMGRILQGIETVI